MVEYRHFAVPNLYLANGYHEMLVGGRIARSYVAEDQLERCVARLLLRSSKPLRGWDFRFLRRQLRFSQQQIGKMVERDAQTVARWEKSRRKVPAFADLLVRARFAARFDPKITVDELLSFVDGRGPKFPERVVLEFSNGNWSFSLQPKVMFAPISASSGVELVRVPTLFRPVESIHFTYAQASARQSARPARQVGRSAKNVVHLQNEGAGYVLLRPFERLEFAATGSQNERVSETKH